VEYRQIRKRVAEALVRASSTFRPDQIEAWEEAISSEVNPHAAWVMKLIVENSQVAAVNSTPLCDDTGIPHLLLELGPQHAITSELLSAVEEGIAQGLRLLPGRPMAICGEDVDRLDQSGGLDVDPSAVLSAPLLVKRVKEDVLRLHVLLEGGGPAIRGRCYRIFHQHKWEVLRGQIVEWGIEAVSLIGCSPCTLAIGIGRSHYEAAALMVEAQVFGSYYKQSSLEDEITQMVNQAGIGALGLGGEMSVLATYMKVGPQRASGVRIVCLRPCCCVEPRVASIELADT